MGTITLRCTELALHPADPARSRWWGKDEWEAYYQATDGALGWGNSPHCKQDWNQLHDEGCRYCATFEHGAVVAMAGLWPRSMDEWEVIAVGVKTGETNRGLGREIVAFATNEILRNGRTATLTTGEDNLAMQMAARALGYREAGRQQPAFTMLERAVLSWFAEHSAILHLREQIEHAILAKRDCTGVGSFTMLSVPRDLPAIDSPRSIMGPIIEGPEIEFGGSAILFRAEDGYIETLEMVANGDRFTAETESFRLAGWE